MLLLPHHLQLMHKELLIPFGGLLCILIVINEPQNLISHPARLGEIQFERSSSPSTRNQVNIQIRLSVKEIVDMLLT